MEIWSVWSKNSPKLIQKHFNQNISCKIQFNLIFNFLILIYLSSEINVACWMSQMLLHSNECLWTQVNVIHMQVNVIHIQVNMLYILLLLVEEMKNQVFTAVKQERYFWGLFLWNCWFSFLHKYYHFQSSSGSYGRENSRRSDGESNQKRGRVLAGSYNEVSCEMRKHCFNFHYFFVG